jgi:hypothetical protein
MLLNVKPYNVEVWHTKHRQLRVSYSYQSHKNPLFLSYAESEVLGLFTELDFQVMSNGLV